MDFSRTKGILILKNSKPFMWSMALHANVNFHYILFSSYAATAKLLPQTFYVYGSFQT